MLLLGCCACCLWSVVSHATTLRTQTITLRKGWNSICLQVTPTNLSSDTVFNNTPITIAATYTASTRPVEFVRNPGAIRWKNEGWSVWYAPNRADSFLTTLTGVPGNRAYLVYSPQDYTWLVTGEVTFEPTQWKSDSFNHVGFCLDEQSPPTFEKFFSGSAAHSSPSRIYRLVGDQWMLTDAVHTPMRSGEACWVYCKGRSDYQGPLQLKLNSVQRIAFTPKGEAGIGLVNQSSDPLAVRVQTVANDEGLPLSYILRAITPGRIDPVNFDLPQDYALPQSLEAGQTSSLWLKLRREQMTGPSQSTLLKITTDNGVQLWVPVVGQRPDLAVAQ